MKKIRIKDLWFLFAFAGLFFYLVPPVPADQIIITGNIQFNFAYSCMKRGEFSLAVGEFERFIYLFPKDLRVLSARYLVGICYLKSGRHEAARDVFSRIINSNAGSPLAGKALLLTGESYYQQGISKEAGHYFRQVIEKYSIPELKNAALYRLGWTSMYENRWRDASEIFSKVEEESLFFDSSQGLMEKSLEGETLPYKNPKLSGALAALMPGLGHAYVSRYKDAAVAFIINGLFIWAAAESFHQDHEVLGYMLAFLEIGWYTGNIYSAVNVANKQNQKVRNEFKKSLIDSFDLHLFTSRDGQLGLRLTFHF